MPYSKSKNKKNDIIFPSYTYAIELKNKLIDDELISVVNQLIINTDDNVEKFLLKCLIKIITNNNKLKFNEKEFKSHCLNFDRYFYREECIKFGSYLIEETDDKNQIEQIVDIIIKKNKMPKVVTLNELRNTHKKNWR